MVEDYKSGPNSDLLFYERNKQNIDIITERAKENVTSLEQKREINGCILDFLKLYNEGDIEEAEKFLRIVDIYSNKFIEDFYQYSTDNGLHSVLVEIIYNSTTENMVKYAIDILSSIEAVDSTFVDFLFESRILEYLLSISINDLPVKHIEYLYTLISNSMIDNIDVFHIFTEVYMTSFLDQLRYVDDEYIIATQSILFLLCDSNFKLDDSIRAQVFPAVHRLSIAGETFGYFKCISLLLDCSYNIIKSFYDLLTDSHIFSILRTNVANIKDRISYENNEIRLIKSNLIIIYKMLEKAIHSNYTYRFVNSLPFSDLKKMIKSRVTPFITMSYAILDIACFVNYDIITKISNYKIISRCLRDIGDYNYKCQSSALQFLISILLKSSHTQFRGLIYMDVFDKICELIDTQDIYLVSKLYDLLTGRNDWELGFLNQYEDFFFDIIEKNKNNEEIVEEYEYILRCINSEEEDLYE